MASALILVFVAMVLGAVLGNLHAPRRGKDVYVAGVKVELVSFDAFRVPPPVDVDMRFGREELKTSHPGAWHAYWYGVRQKVRVQPKRVMPDLTMDVYVQVMLDGLLLRGLSGGLDAARAAPDGSYARWRAQTDVRRGLARRFLMPQPRT